MCSINKKDYTAILETFRVMSSPGIMEKIEAAENGKPEDFISLEEFRKMLKDEEHTE